jgi:hypothetical protein
LAIKFRKVNIKLSFIKTNGQIANIFTKPLLDLIYVDDLILRGNNIDEIKALKMLLDKKFRIKDIGTLKYFLGL